MRWHAHYKNYVDWNKSDDTETSTSSTAFVTLLETIRKTVDFTHVIEFSLSHNVKNTGTLASRGATFKIVGFDDVGEFDVSPEFRWTDGLADYKLMAIITFKSVSAPIGQLGFRVKWKVDDASYPCWSKNRYFVARSYNWGGYLLFEG